MSKMLSKITSGENESSLIFKVLSLIEETSVVSRKIKFRRKESEGISFVNPENQSISTYVTVLRTYKERLLFFLNE